MLFCGIIMQGSDGMTLQEAKDLLSRNSICFDICEFKNESEYWRHTMLFPYTKNAKNCKVVALIIKSNQGRMNIELQFNKTANDFIFEELRFGGFCFEMFDYQEEMLADDLLDRIKEITNGNFTVIIKNDLKNKKWLADACFDLDDDDDAFGRQGFEQAIQRIRQPKGFISKLLKSKLQYEIYNWNTYDCIVK